MKESKMLILELLKEGKIDTEQALLLLDGLKSESESGYKGFSRQSYKKPNSEKQFEKEIKKFSKTVEKFSEDLGEKFKEVEPIIKDTSKKVMNKTVDILNDIVEKFDDIREEKNTTSYDEASENGFEYEDSDIEIIVEEAEEKTEEK